ncbi:MAG: RND family transporter, partial [Pseudomonadota bacterium]|nr:RND family transporter [Pseudomonadota bacterium]
MSPIRGLSRHPVSVLLVFLIVAAGLTAFVGRFEVNASADTLISEGNRLYIENRVVQQRFSPEEFMFVAYEPRQRSIFDPASLDDLRAMSSAIGKLDRVKSVRSLVNVPLIPADASIGLDGGFNPDDWTMQNRSFSPQRLEQILSGHPIYEGLLVNRKQTATALQVLFKSNARLDELNRQIT